MGTIFFEKYAIISLKVYDHEKSSMSQSVNWVELPLG